MKMLSALTAVLLILLSACESTHYSAPADHPDSAQVWTPSQITGEMGGSDPIEPFNRAMFAVNDTLMHYLVRPISWIYGSILPLEVIRRIENISRNLAAPGRIISCLCQAKFTGGGIVFVRFLTNTTIGICGIFDPADAWMGLAPMDENMGKAFAKWGIGPGFVLVLPLLPSANIRDHIGYAFDSALDIKCYLPYAGYLFTLNRVVNGYDAYTEATETFSDPYEMAKMALCAFRYATVRDYQFQPLPYGPQLRLCEPAIWLNRKNMTFDFRRCMDDYLAGGMMRKLAVLSADIPQENLIRIAKDYRPQGSETDTMKFAFFKMQHNAESMWVKSSIWNTDFISLAEEKTVRISADPEASELPYHLWSHKENPEAPLTILLPGVGGHHKSPQLRALAESLYMRGYSVVILGSMYNTVFMESSRHFLPGNTRHDAKILHGALRKILADLRKDPQFRPPEIYLAGYSMGGLHTLFIADLERKKTELQIRRYVALNPPVDLKYALKQFDGMFERSREWTREEFFRYGSDALLKFYSSAEKTKKRLTPENGATPCYILPITSRQAAVMAGLSFRLTLRDILLSVKRRNPDWSLLRTPWSWWNRRELYREIDSFSGMDYAEKCLLPEYRKKHPEASLDQLNYESGLRCIRETLEKDSSIRVLHNVDDPLLSASDRQYLQETLGSRIKWFDCGGHLGNLFVKKYENTLHDCFPVLKRKSGNSPANRKK